MGNNICPVCGYAELSQPPYDPETKVATFDICPCCGCEFGYNDATPEAKRRYLRDWIQRGTPWFDPKLKPLHWNLKKQLLSIGIDLDSFA